MPPWLALAFQMLPQHEVVEVLKRMGNESPALAEHRLTVEQSKSRDRVVRSILCQIDIGPCREMAGTSLEDHRLSVAHHRRMGEPGESPVLTTAKLGA